MALIRKTITFADRTKLDILDATTIVPSGSSYIRSYMELHMPEDAMSIGAFETLMNTEDKTKSMIIETTTKDETSGEESTAVEILNSYIIAAEVGKKVYETVDPFSGNVLKETHLIARLEQLTYIEQKLHELGVL